MRAESCASSSTLSDSFHAQSFSHYGKMVLSAYRDSHNRVRRWKTMDFAEPVSFDKLLDMTLGNMATRMSQGLTVLQQYFNVMHVFNYDAKYKRWLLKWMNEGPLEMALEKANKFFFPRPKSSSSSVVTIALSVSHCSGCKRSSPVKIISLDIEQPED